jgi:Protein of unknown function (DUF1552)
MIVIRTGRPLIRRRAFLRAAGAVVTLPLLEAMRPTAARAATAPKRFVVMFSPNGTIYPNWVPTGGETDFVLSPILQPLAPVRSDLVVISGLFQQGGGGDGHQNGIGGMLTGQSLNPGPFQGGGNSGTSGWAGGISVDQRIAAKIGGGTRFRSLELGVQVASADNWSRMSYLGSDRPLPPEDSPLGAYMRLFAGASASPEEVARLRARRRSVLDAVKVQFDAVSARVGTADRARLDAHATSIREIENRLDVTASTATCNDPGAPALPANPTANDSFPAVGKLQMDLLALALSCDLTRVASLQWSRSVSQVRFTWLGIREGHHDLSHLADDDTQAVGKLTQINTWYAQQFAYLVGKLAGTIEVDGSRLLDSSLLLWCNELGKGNAHSRKLAPYVLAGSAGGALRTGRFLNYTGDQPHNDLLVSLLQAMDVPATTFGKVEWCHGPLAGVL